MLKCILTFMQILDLIGKWISKAIKNYHITSCIILTLNILGKISNHQRPLLSGFNIFLIVILAIWVYRKYHYWKRSYGPVINIKNENSITNINENKD